MQIFISILLIFSLLSCQTSNEGKIVRSFGFETIKKEYNFEDLNYLISFYCKKYDVNEKLILAIAEVETRTRNLIGDKHLQNKAYGYFQIRQPALEQVNKIFKLNRISYACDLLNDIDAQVEYVVLFVKHLYDVTSSEKEAISAYNIGIGNVKKGKLGNYYNKIKKEMEKL